MTESPRRGVPLVVLVAALAAASGATDVASFIRLGGVFASVMTGNLVLLGLSVQRASGILLAHAVVAIAGYTAGVAAGARICASRQRDEALWPSAVTVALAAEFLVFAGFTLGWELTGGQPAGPSQLALLAGAAIAMGLQSEAMRNVGTTLSTTYLTGTLTGAVASLVTRSRGGNVMSFAVLGSAAAGAAAGAALIAAAPAMLPVLPLTAIAGVVAWAMTAGRAAPAVQPGQTHPPPD
jgi:uncharacterized membrane protein YoaK (UPF0700 family)